MRRLLHNLATLMRGRQSREVRLPQQPPPTRQRSASTTVRSTTARPNPVRSSAAPPRRGRQLVYAPQVDGQADPGEIVWTWVPYEEDETHGKDRPVLVVGRDGSTLQGLMLSSNGDRDGQQHWFALGTGSWDTQGRRSWIRLDRVIEVDEDGIRREGAILDRRRFDAVAAELRDHYGWR